MRTEDEGENNQRGSENKNGKDTVSTCTGICCDHKNGHNMELDPTVSPNVSANSWLTVGQQLTDCLWTVGRLLGDKATSNENTNHALVMSLPCIGDVLELCMFTFSTLFNILCLLQNVALISWVSNWSALKIIFLHVLP